jgi:hypothetical protein
MYEDTTISKQRTQAARVASASGANTSHVLRSSDHHDTTVVALPSLSSLVLFVTFRVVVVVRFIIPLTISLDRLLSSFIVIISSFVVTVWSFIAINPR